MAKNSRTSSPPRSTVELLTGDDYHAALMRDIPKAKKRIVIAAMVLVWGERTAPIFEALKDARRRGIKVCVLIDNYTKLSARYNLQPRPTRSKRVRRTFETLEELSGLGASIYCFGRLGIVPYKGRCHVKITVIDDTYYSFGGFNLLDQSFDFHDFMLKSHAGDFADALCNLVERIGTTMPPLADEELPMNDVSSILFDGGRPGHSIIYERASELTAQATRLYCVTQYTPSGELAKLMHETNAICYFNRPEQLIAPDSWGQAFDQQRYRLTNSYTGTELIHAKFLLAELPSGQYATLCGSHNFSYRGVAFGTQEIALYSTDKALWDRLYTYMQSIT